MIKDDSEIRQHEEENNETERKNSNNESDDKTSAETEEDDVKKDKALANASIVGTFKQVMNGTWIDSTIEGYRLGQAITDGVGSITDKAIEKLKAIKDLNKNNTNSNKNENTRDKDNIQAKPNQNIPPTSTTKIIIMETNKKETPDSLAKEDQQKQHEYFKSLIQTAYNSPEKTDLLAKEISQNPKMKKQFKESFEYLLDNKALTDNEINAGRAFLKKVTELSKSVLTEDSKEPDKQKDTPDSLTKEDQQKQHSFFKSVIQTAYSAPEKTDRIAKDMSQNPKFKKQFRESFEYLLDNKALTDSEINAGRAFLKKVTELSKSLKKSQSR